MGTMTIATGAAQSSFADWANAGTITYEGGHGDRPSRRLRQRRHGRDHRGHTADGADGHGRNVQVN
jgi:hypothetical protein